MFAAAQRLALGARGMPMLPMRPARAAAAAAASFPTTGDVFPMRWLSTEGEPSTSDIGSEEASDSAWAVINNIPRTAFRSDVLSFLADLGASVPAENVYAEYDQSYRRGQWFVNFGSASSRMLAANQLTEGSMVGARPVRVLPIDEETVASRLAFAKEALSMSPSQYVVVDKIPPSATAAEVEDVFRHFEKIGPINLFDSEIPKHKLGHTDFKPFKIAVITMASEGEALRAVREKQGIVWGGDRSGPGGKGSDAAAVSRIRVKVLQ